MSKEGVDSNLLFSVLLQAINTNTVHFSLYLKFSEEDYVKILESKDELKIKKRVESQCLFKMFSILLF
jgi:hypothetical protein